MELPESLVYRLLEQHTPTQIRLGFQNYAEYEPEWVARLILKGRYGYRRGIKANKRKPGKKEVACPTPPPPKKEETRPDQLLRDFLNE